MAGETDSLLNSSTGRKAVGALPSYGAKVSVGVPGIQPAFGAEALGSAISRLAQVGQQGMDEVGRRQYQQAGIAGGEAGAQAGMNTPDLSRLQLPDDPSAYSRAFRDSAVQAAGARVGLQARDDVERIYNDHRGRPVELRSALDASLKGFVGGLPPGLQETAFHHYALYSHDKIAAADEQFHRETIDTNRAALFSKHDADMTDAANAAYNRDWGKAQALVENQHAELMRAGPLSAGGNGSMSAQEIEKAYSDGLDGISMAYAKGALANATDPRALLAGLKDGKTGDEVLDAAVNRLGPDKRTAFISSAEADIRTADQQAAIARREKYQTTLVTQGAQAALDGLNGDIKAAGGRAYGAILGLEWNGKGTPISYKDGQPVAYGASQMLPSTARDVMRDVGGYEGATKLDDASLGAWLVEHPDDARSLGRTYFDQQVERYDGNLTLAAAAYNAGHGAVDAAKKAGATTDEQIVAALPEETQKYVAGFKKRLGPQDPTLLADMRLAQRDAASFTQADLKGRMRDEENRLGNGQPLDKSISDDEVRRAYPGNPAQGEAATLAWQKRRAVAYATGQARTLSIPEQEQLRGAAAAGLDKGDPEQSAAYDTLTKAIDKDQQALRAKPGDYVADSSPYVAQGWANARQDPSLLFDAVGRSIAIQRQKGLTDAELAPMPAGDATSTVTRWKNAKTGDERLASVAWVASLDDPEGAPTLAQLQKAGLPKGAEFVIDLLQQGRDEPAKELASRIGVDSSKLSLGDAKPREITDAVRGWFTSGGSPGSALMYAANASVAPKNRELLDSAKGMMEALTRQYAGDGLDPSAAAEKAGKLLFGDAKVAGYEGLGIVTVPAGVDAQALTTGLEGLRASVDLSHIAPTEALVRSFMPKGTPDVQIRAELYRAEHDHAALTDDIRRYGTWVNVAGGYALVGPAGGFVPGAGGNGGSEGAATVQWQPRVWSAQDALQAGKAPPVKLILDNPFVGS